MGDGEPPAKERQRLGRSFYSIWVLQGEHWIN